MRPSPSSLLRLGVSLWFVSIVSLSVDAQAQRDSIPTPAPRITQAVDDAKLTTLRGNTHPFALARFDRGAAPASMPLERMLLVLKRSSEQDAALIALLDQQQDKSSPNYHKWLKPEEFGARFGPADSDIQAVTAWLQTHGFQIGKVSKGRTVIEFSGTAAMLQEAFHTEIHRYLVSGDPHWANATDPQIPSALAPVVAGVWTLHDFVKMPQARIAEQRIEARIVPGRHPEFTSTSGLHAIVPADFNKIYNMTPNFGISGSIGIVGRTNINTQDITYFHYFTSDQASTPTVVLNGPDPGNLGGGEEAEAVLDATWSSAVAPRANVYLVVSATTSTTDGVDLSELYIVDNDLTDVMSESFGGCEAGVTAAEANGIASIAQQAAAQGITYLVSSGDSGSAGCDDPNSQSQATHPPSVNVLAATPYNIAVGGTLFNENGHPTTYWSPTTDPSTLGSALSYIPENVWNESCTGTKCGTAKPNIWAGGGGVSTLFPKPSWQSGVTGIPADQARDLPDVSLSAAGHDPYLICVADSCVPDTQGRIFFAGIGGTSASAPAFAGILATVAGQTGSRLGQANYVLYRLAAAENLTQCNGSSTTVLPAATCVFNDVTVGNNAVPGETGYNTASAKYPSTKGYDLGAGLGSVNVQNLVAQWTSVAFQATNTTFSISPHTLVHGAPATVTVNVSPMSAPGTPTGSVWLQGGLAHGNLIGDSTVQAFTLDNSGNISGTTHSLPGGTYSYNAHYAGDGTFAPSDSAPPVSITVQPEPTTTTITVFTARAGGSLIPYSGGTYGMPLYFNAHVAGNSGYGTPTMWINIIDTMGSGLGSAYLDNRSSDALSPVVTSLDPGPHSIEGGYVGDSSFNSSTSPAVNFIITKAATATSVQATATKVASGSPITLTAAVDTTSMGNSVSGSVAFFNGATQLPGTAGLVPVFNSPASMQRSVATYQASLPDGTNNITAQYLADSDYNGSTSSSVTVTVAPDFSLAFTGPPGSVMTIAAPGGSGSLTLSVTGAAGYNGTVNFANCTHLPLYSTCTFNPASVAGSGSTTLTLTTTAPHSASNRVAPSVWAATGGFTLAGIFVLGFAPRKRCWTSIVALLMLAWLLATLGCGGSSGGGGGGGTPGTRPGTYTVTATGADSNFSHPVTFTVTVQ